MKRSGILSTREARHRAAKKYQAANTKLLQIRLNLKTDKDIFEKLDTVDSKSGYVKKLIRNDINRSF